MRSSAPRRRTSRISCAHGSSELVEDLPESHEVRRYAEEKAELLDRLGYASSKAEEGPREPRTRPGWETIPSTAPADEPLKP